MSSRGGFKPSCTRALEDQRAFVPPHKCGAQMRPGGSWSTTRTFPAKILSTGVKTPEMRHVPRIVLGGSLLFSGLAGAVSTSRSRIKENGKDPSTLSGTLVPQVHAYPSL